MRTRIESHTCSPDTRKRTIFITILRRVSDDIWTYRPKCDAFSEWIADTTGDMERAEELRHIGQDDTLNASESQRPLWDAVASLYAMSA